MSRDYTEIYIKFYILQFQKKIVFKKVFFFPDQGKGFLIQCIPINKK